MACRFANRSIPFLSFLLIIVILFVFSSSSTCIDAHKQETNNDDGRRDLDFDTEGGGGHELMLRWESDDDIRRRSLGADAQPNSPMVLAQHRTLRKDPSDKFRLYTGGWNITNSHYWVSVIFTAVPFFALAVVWLVVFLIAALVACCCYCCCERKPDSYSRLCYAISLTCLILFTVAAILGCIFLYSGQGSFFRSTNRMLQYVVSQASVIAGKLKDVERTFSRVKTIGLDKVTAPPELVDGLNDIEGKMEKVSKMISEHAGKFSKLIHKYTNKARLYSYILPAVMLGVAFIGFVLSIFGLECLVYTLVILGWILVALMLILSGAFLGIHNVVVDSCVAMGDWVQNPQAHTALDDVLPCVDKDTARIFLKVSQRMTNIMVGMVDAGVDTVANDQKLINYRQSGPPVPTVCNPFNLDLTNRTCKPGEVELGRASEELKNYMCEAEEVNGRQMCVTTGRLTPNIYTQMDSIVNVSNGVYLYTPFFIELTDCTFVRNTFRDIHQNNCPELRKYTRQIYSGLLTVAAAVMLSLIFWVIYARERRHRIYTKKRTANVMLK